MRMRRKHLHPRSSAAPLLSRIAMPEELREAIRALCRKYPEEYWSKLDQERAYPVGFVQELTGNGYLGCLIPEEYGGAGQGLMEASAILEEVNRSGGNAAACH